MTTIRILWLAAILVLASCGGGDADDEAPEGIGGMGAMGDLMGGQALGASAETRVLARVRLMEQPPAGAAWVAFEVTLEPGGRLEHTHAFATVYAPEGRHLLTAGSEQTVLMAGAGAAVQAGVEHVHESPPDTPPVFWEVLLTEPGASLPGAPGAVRLFASGPLEGVPEGATAALVDVVLPPSGGRTSVHTHPGPELIYITEGRFQHESGLEGIKMVGPGDVEAIPPGTPVQKRNLTSERARFLSWFLVDPDKPFAPPADFMDAGG